MSNYIMDLRKVVGHAPLLQCAGSVIIENENVEIIYLCRKYHGTLKRQEEEVEELRFFALADIPAEISDPIAPVVRKYIEMRKTQEK